MLSYGFQGRDHLRKILLLLRLAASVVLLLFIPIALYQMDSPWLGYSYSKSSSIFEYFGFVGSVVFFLNLAIELKQRKFGAAEKKYFLIAFSGFIFIQLVLFSELSKIGWDYLAYQESVRALLANQSPYHSLFTANHPYIYPPLLAQFMTLFFRGISWTCLNVFGRAPGEETAFFLLFYFYQAVQFCLTLLCFYLSYRAARLFRLNERSAAFLVFVLFTVNLPLYRNFSQNQVNLWILLSILLSILWIQEKPVLSGLVIAFGTHLKLYPILQAFAWLIAKKWRALTSLFVFLIGIFLVETSGGRNLRLWTDFISYLSKVEKGAALRNNSLYSLSYNLSRLVFGGQDQIINTSASILTLILTGILVSWILYRIFQRMKQQGISEKENLYGNMIDCIFLMFFVSPSVWDHHLVSAIPLVIWVFANRPGQVWGKAGLAAALIFFLPTYDVFLFSYTRLAGMILLLSIAPITSCPAADQPVDLFDPLLIAPSLPARYS